MNALMNTPAMMSSREIADLTGKEHKNVLVDIEKLIVHYEDMRLAEISADLYKDSYGRDQKCYQLSRMQTFDLMTGYDTKLRIKVNRRWEELETVSRSVPAAELADLRVELAELRSLILIGRRSDATPKPGTVLPAHHEEHIRRFWLAMSAYPLTKGVHWVSDPQYLYIRMSLVFPFYEAYCAAQSKLALSSYDLIRIMRGGLYAPYVTSSQKGANKSYHKAGFGRCFRFRYTLEDSTMCVGGVKLGI